MAMSTQVGRGGRQRSGLVLGWFSLIGSLYKRMGCLVVSTPGGCKVLGWRCTGRVLCVNGVCKQRNPLRDVHIRMVDGELSPQYLIGVGVQTVGWASGGLAASSRISQIYLRQRSNLEGLPSMHQTNPSTRNLVLRQPIFDSSERGANDCLSLEANLLTEVHFGRWVRTATSSSLTCGVDLGVALNKFDPNLTSHSAAGIPCLHRRPAACHPSTRAGHRARPNRHSRARGRRWCALHPCRAVLSHSTS